LIARGILIRQDVRMYYQGFHVAQVQTVEEATQLALDLVRKYYSFAFPISARRENSRWIIDLDISYFKPSYMRVKILAESGALEDFKVTLGPLL